MRKNCDQLRMIIAKKIIDTCKNYCLNFTNDENGKRVFIRVINVFSRYTLNVSHSFLGILRFFFSKKDKKGNFNFFFFACLTLRQ